MLNLRPIYVGKSPRTKPRKRKQVAALGGWFLLMLVIGISFYLRRLFPSFNPSEQRPLQ